MLQFTQEWRFNSPGHINNEIQNSFHELIVRSARGQQKILEHFKSYFAYAAGSTPSWSSSESWADADLQGYMSECSDNAPLFIEAFYDACKELKANHPEFSAPDTAHINRILAKHSSLYKIEDPNLIYVGESPIHHETPEIPLSFDERARETIKASFEEAHKFLSENRHRQAVQELLWLLETVITAFKGQDEGGSTIAGKYFNSIVKEMRQKNKGKVLDQIITWMTNLHGYLSAPAGGGVRHGIDLKEGLALTDNEAYLFCNLIISYIKFFLGEYDKLKTDKDFF